MVRQRIAFSVSLSSSAPGNTGGRYAASWALISSMATSIVLIFYMISIEVLFFNSYNLRVLCVL